MKKIVLAIFAITIAFFPVLAFGAPGSIEGTIQGYNCVTQGRTCPLGMEDPLAATENIFVVLTPGNKYYFVPNLDRAILARHINEQVRVTGDVDQARSSIRAQRLEVNQNGRWRTAWDYDMQRQFQESGSGPYRRQP